MLALQERDDGVLVPVRVQPRASRDEVVGVDAAGALRVRLKAPPVDGAANEALLRFLGRGLLGVPPTSLELVRGHTGRDKVVRVPGLTADEVRARLLG